MILVIEKQSNQFTVQKQVVLRVRIVEFSIPSGINTSIFTEAGQLIAGIGNGTAAIVPAPTSSGQALRSNLDLNSRMAWLGGGDLDVLAPAFTGWRDATNAQIDNTAFFTGLQTLTAANRARGLPSGARVTPSGTYPGSNAFVGGVLLPDGRVFCVPFSSTSARIYDPNTDTLSTPTGTYPGSSAFFGGVLLPDGRVFCVPYSSTSGAIANTRSHLWLDSNFTTSPFFNKF